MHGGAERARVHEHMPASGHPQLLAFTPVSVCMPGCMCMSTSARMHAVHCACTWSGRVRARARA
eukprot:6187271-Pleurochrysis_carterae.AAC.3